MKVLKEFKGNLAWELLVQTILFSYGNDKEFKNIYSGSSCSGCFSFLMKIIRHSKEIQLGSSWSRSFSFHMKVIRNFKEIQLGHSWPRSFFFRKKMIEESREIQLGSSWSRLFFHMKMIKTFTNKLTWESAPDPFLFI